jgi:hypothetical protein
MMARGEFRHTVGVGLHFMRLMVPGGIYRNYGGRVNA